MTIVDIASPPADDTGQLVALAELIAHHHPRPFALDTANRNAAWLLDIPTAAASREAYAVTVRHDVLAIDADDPRLLYNLDRYADDLAADGWPVLRVDSGRQGHRHLFAVIPDRAARETWARACAARGLPEPRTVMRPPGSPHRAGLPVTLCDDAADFTAAVEIVRAAACGSRPEAGVWRELLRTGRWWRNYSGEGTGSAMVWHICIGAIRDGLNLAAVRELLTTPTNRGGAAYRNRFDRQAKQHADHWLEHYVWPSATRAAGQTITPPADAAEALDRLDQLQAAVEASHWPGTGGATDRAVILALITQGKRHATLTPSLSHRGLAEHARVTRRTVSTSTARLRTAGWLMVAEKGRGRTVTATDGVTLTERADATRWRLRLPENARELSPRVVTPPAGTPLDGVGTRALVDVGRWCGIGMNGPRVLDALADGSLTARELGEVLGLNVGNLRARLLPRLADLGLLVREGSRWSLVEDLEAALEAASVELGTEGKAAAVRKMHDAERAGYLDWREHHRPARVEKSIRRRRAERAVEHVSDPELFDWDTEIGLLCCSQSADIDPSGTYMPPDDAGPLGSMLVPAGEGADR